MPPVINKEKCVGCDTCAQICPVDVIKFNKSLGMPEIRYPEECWHCNSCVLDCRQGAIRLRIPLPAQLLYVDVKSVRGE